jgi:hypothetical protein
LSDVELKGETFFFTEIDNIQYTLYKVLHLNT